MVPFLSGVSFTEGSVRFPTVVVGVVDVALMAFVARRILRDERRALRGCPAGVTLAHSIDSRIAMDYLYPAPLFVRGWSRLLLALSSNTASPHACWIAAAGLCICASSYIRVGHHTPGARIRVDVLALFMAGERRARPILPRGRFALPLLIAVVRVTRHTSISSPRR